MALGNYLSKLVEYSIMIEFNGNTYFNVSEVAKLFKEKNSFTLFRHLNHYVLFDGLVEMQKIPAEKIQKHSEKYSQMIQLELVRPENICLLFGDETFEPFNFEGIFSYTFNSNSPLYFTPTADCLIDGEPQLLNEHYYFPHSLNNFIESIKRKFIQETSITHDDLYFYNLKSELFNPSVKYIVHFYFSQKEIEQFSKSKKIQLHHEGFDLKTKFPNTIQKKDNENSTIIEDMLNCVEQKKQHINIKLIQSTLQAMKENRYPFDPEKPVISFMSFATEDGKVHLIYEITPTEFILTNGKSHKINNLKQAFRRFYASFTESN